MDKTDEKGDILDDIPKNKESAFLEAYSKDIISILESKIPIRGPEALEKLQNLLRTSLVDLEGLKVMTHSNFECATKIQLKRFSSNEVIFCSYDLDDSLFVVLRGRVGIDKYFGKFTVFKDNKDADLEDEEDREFQRNRFVRVLMPGSVLGQTCLISDNSGRRPVKAFAIGEVLLACLEKKYMGKELDVYKNNIAILFEVLRRQEAFRTWNIFNLKSLVYIFGKYSFPINSLVAKEGEKIEKLWILKSGDVSVDKTISLAKKGEKFVQKKSITVSKISPGEIIDPLFTEASEYSIKCASSGAEMYFLSKREFLNYILSDGNTLKNLKIDFEKISQFRASKIEEIQTTYASNENFLTKKFTEKRKNIGLIQACYQNLEAIVQEKRLLDTLKYRSDESSLRLNAKKPSSNSRESRETEGSDLGTQSGQKESKLKKLLNPNKTAGGVMVSGLEKTDFRDIISSKLRSLNLDEFSLRSKILQNLQECSHGMETQDSLKARIEIERNEKLELRKLELLKRDDNKNESIQDGMDANESAHSQRYWGNSPSVVGSPFRVESPTRRNDKSDERLRTKDNLIRPISSASIQRDPQITSVQSLCKIPLNSIEFIEEEEFLEDQTSQNTDLEKTKNHEKQKKIDKKKSLKKQVTEHEALIAKIKSEGDLFLKRINIRARNISENELRKRTFLKFLRKESTEGQTMLIEEEEKPESFNFVRTFQRVKKQVPRLSLSKQKNPDEKHNTSIDSKRHFKTPHDSDIDSVYKSIHSQQEFDAIGKKNITRTLSPDVRKRFNHLKERVMSANFYNYSNTNENFVRVGSPIENRNPFRTNINYTSRNNSSMVERSNQQKIILKKHERNLTDPSPKKKLNNSITNSVANNVTIFKRSSSPMDTPQSLRNVLIPFEILKSKTRPPSVISFKKSNSQTLNIAFDRDNKLRLIRQISFTNHCV